MANISAIKLPSGNTYNIKDNVSGYTTSENITQEEYDALTPAQKSDDIIYFIYDGTPTPGPTPVSNLQNLVDGSATASVRGIGTTAESGSYTMGTYAFAEGYDTKASSSYSHVEGYETRTSGEASHAEGYGTEATGSNSHAEGLYTLAGNDSSHSEGSGTAANGVASHAEGDTTSASGYCSHAEGSDSQATGGQSHAEGFYTVASGSYSHAQNTYTIAQRKSQTALGEYNIADTTGTTTTRGKYAVIVGNGTADNARSNALTVDWSGNTSQQGHATTKDMTSSEVTSFVNSLDLTGSKAADYVVEQGTSGVWTYRKWQSGIAECWGTYSASIAITTASVNYGGYRSEQITAPTFPLIFTSAPSVTATSNTTGGYWLNNVLPSTTSVSFYLSAGSSMVAAARPVAFHVIGKWK